MFAGVLAGCSPSSEPGSEQASGADSAAGPGSSSGSGKPCPGGGSSCLPKPGRPALGWHGSADRSTIPPPPQPPNRPQPPSAPAPEESARAPELAYTSAASLKEEDSAPDAPGREVEEDAAGKEEPEGESNQSDGSGKAPQTKTVACQLWTDPPNCPACKMLDGLHLEKSDKRVLSLCRQPPNKVNGASAWKTAKDGGSNPCGGSLPAAIIEGQTFCNTKDIANGILQAAGLQPLPDEIFKRK